MLAFHNDNGSSPLGRFETTLSSNRGREEDFAFSFSNHVSQRVTLSCSSATMLNHRSRVRILELKATSEFRLLF